MFSAFGQSCSEKQPPCEPRRLDPPLLVRALVRSSDWKADEDRGDYMWIPLWDYIIQGSYVIHGCSQSQHHKPFRLFNGAPRVLWFQRRSAETCLSTSKGICFQLGGAWNVYCFYRAATTCWGIHELASPLKTSPWSIQVKMVLIAQRSSGWVAEVKFHRSPCSLSGSQRGYIPPKTSLSGQHWVLLNLLKRNRLDANRGVLLSMTRTHPPTEMY